MKIEKGKLCVKMTVADPETGRYVTIEDNFFPHEAAKWFDNTGLATTLSFAGKETTVGMSIKFCGTAKIKLIKELREIVRVNGRHWGLKEAKDASETRGKDIIIFRCHSLEKIKNKLEEYGVEVEFKSTDITSENTLPIVTQEMLDEAGY